jgi:hypothetical protein
MLKKYGSSIEFIDKKIKKPWMYDLAFQQDGNSLKYLPLSKRTYESCKIAVTSNGRSLKYVPEKFKTVEICNIALEKNGLALQYIKNKTIDYCKLAIKQNPSAFYFFQNKVKISFFEDSKGPLDKDLCGICQDNEMESNWCKLNSCSHHYHIDCISSWFKKKKICPLCNTKSIPEVVFI